MVQVGQHSRHDLCVCWSSLAIVHWTLVGPKHYHHLGTQAHSRIVWDVCWSPCGRLAASCSRDGGLRIWRLDSLQGQLHPVGALPSCPVAVTAIAWCPESVLAVGREDGLVELHRLRLLQCEGDVPWMMEDATQIWCSPAWCRHVAAVRRLAWREVSEGWQLASCGDDHLVIVFAAVSCSEVYNSS